MRLEVREVSEVTYVLKPIDQRYPLKIIDEVVSDDEAREKLRELLRSGLYRGEVVGTATDT